MVFKQIPDMCSANASTWKSSKVNDKRLNDTRQFGEFGGPSSMPAIGSYVPPLRC